MLTALVSTAFVLVLVALAATRSGRLLVRRAWWAVAPLPRHQLSREEVLVRRACACFRAGRPDVAREVLVRHDLSRHVFRALERQYGPAEPIPENDPPELVDAHEALAALGRGDRETFERLVRRYPQTS
jgi:hypothetical protein